MVEILSGEAGAKAMASRSGHRYLHSGKAIPGMARLEKADLDRMVIRVRFPLNETRHILPNHGGFFYPGRIRTCMRKLLGVLFGIRSGNSSRTAVFFIHPQKQAPVYYYIFFS